MSLLKKATSVWNVIDRIHSVGIILSAATLAFMALLIFYEVFMRYVFKSPSDWGLDLSEFSMVMCVFFAASYVLVRKRHVRVEILLFRMPPKAKLILEIVSSVIMFLFFIILIWKSSEMALRSYTMDWRTPDLASLQIWIPQMIIPLGGIMLALAVIGQLGSQIKALRSAGK